jgi:L-threonylcarbamoyladenylate synthase
LGISIEIESKIQENKVRTSGLLESHYAPIAKVFIIGKPKAGDGLIAIDSFPTPPGVIRLADPTDSDEFARVLYKALRLADEKNLERVFVIPPTGNDIAVAINDRLRRCAFKG